MAFFRQYIAPFFVVLIFLLALLAVSARIFLPSDMAAPAPVEEVTPQHENSQVSIDKATAGLPAAYFSVERLTIS